MANVEVGDIVGGLIIGVVTLVLVVTAQNGNMNAEILRQGITGYALGAALIVGILGVFLRNWGR